MGNPVTFVDKPGVVEAANAAGLSLYFHQDNRAGTARWETDGDVTAVNAFITSYDPLPYNKQQKLEALGGKYAGLIAAGRSYTVPGDSSGAHVYQIDEVSPTPNRQSSLASIGDVAAMADRAVRNGVTGTPWDAGQPAFKFYDGSNVGVPMTAQQAYDFATNVGTYVNAIKQNYLKLAAQISGAADQTALDAIDVGADWPANP